MHACMKGDGTKLLLGIVVQYLKEGHSTQCIQVNVNSKICFHLLGKGVKNSAFICTMHVRSDIITDARLPSQQQGIESEGET